MTQKDKNKAPKQKHHFIIPLVRADYFAFACIRQEKREARTHVEICLLVSERTLCVSAFPAGVCV